MGLILLRTPNASDLMSTNAYFGDRARQGKRKELGKGTEVFSTVHPFDNHRFIDLHGLVR